MNMEDKYLYGHHKDVVRLESWGLMEEDLDWRWIGGGLAVDWWWIGGGLPADWRWIGDGLVVDWWWIGALRVFMPCAQR